MHIIRKIRNGKVKIGGQYFTPDERHKKYDGRLDGLQMFFGLYDHRPNTRCEQAPPITYSGQQYEAYINLWGTEEMHNMIKQWNKLPREEKTEEAYLENDRQFCEACGRNPSITSNGYLPWDIWRTEEEHKAQAKLDKMHA